MDVIESKDISEAMGTLEWVEEHLEVVGGMHKKKYIAGIQSVIGMLSNMRRDMDMKKQVILEEEDIAQIIAEKFSVERGNVLIEMVQNIEGYGRGEWISKKARATVQVPLNDSDWRG